MNKVEYILSCISEEAGEIVQDVGKAHRFGLYDTYSGKTNLSKINQEICDILGAYWLLCDELGVTGDLPESRMKEKKEKIKHYMKYSKEVGALSS